MVEKLVSDLIKRNNGICELKNREYINISIVVIKKISYSPNYKNKEYIS